MRALFCNLAASALLVALGCAHAEAPRPAAGAAPSPASSAPSSPATSETNPETTATRALDPSEEITPEELATIPEPVPRSQAGTSPTGDETPPRPAPSTATPQTPPPSNAREPEAGQYVWRVQVFASADRAEAERAGANATSRLGEPHVIVLEGGLYKVRLGAMTTEAEAQALRERAIQNGFPGAFRIRTLK